jgi:hypothetical protein
MNLLCDVAMFQPYHVCFLDTKKNMVIDGTFTKIIYSDSVVSLNGLYIHCPLDPLQVPTLPMSSHPHHHHGYSGVSHSKPTILATYQENGMTVVTKKVSFAFSLNDATPTASSTPSLPPPRAFGRQTPLLSNNHNNIQLVKELNRIEHEMIEYYKEFFKINHKINVYSLRNQLKTGYIKVIQKVQLPPSSTSFQGSGDNANASKSLVIKISGIWETDSNVGITFKFQM